MYSTSFVCLRLTRPLGYVIIIPFLYFVSVVERQVPFLLVPTCNPPPLPVHVFSLPLLLPAPQNSPCDFCSVGSTVKQGDGDGVVNDFLNPYIGFSVFYACLRP